jgi:DNA invertase Pin-like site-specific DNA recombinase
LAKVLLQIYFERSFWVQFKACDLPEADHFTVHQFAALAEKARKIISRRNKTVLAARQQGEVINRKNNIKEESRQKAR